MKNRYLRHAVLGLAAAVLMTPSGASAEDIFEGLYGAIEAGVGAVKREGTTFVGPIDETDTSSILGGAVGVRTSLDTDRRFVIGVEAGSDFYTDTSEWRYGISGTAGVKVHDNGLAYLRVGYGKFSGDSLDHDGMVLGGGYEHVLSERTSLRFDYRSLFYGDVNFPDNSVDYHGQEITAALVIRLGRSHL